MNTHRWIPLALLSFVLVVGAGCVTDETIADDLLEQTARSEANAPLGGEALVQRKLDLDRSYRDLSHFHATLESLNRRGDRGASVMFREFVDMYLVKHVLPLLEGEWQSRHPEVAVLDVNVRFAVAELWLQMGSPSSTDRMLEEIERRYPGRGEMVVSYPLGSQGTLREGIERLRNRDWWNG
ncbi:MAG: hypothetical protein AAF430_00520 [Myxococcota bacterium]